LNDLFFLFMSKSLPKTFVAEWVIDETLNKKKLFIFI